MAELKRTYPMLPVGHWWALRAKFKQSIPGVVTNNYLATTLSMGVDSARANVLPFLKTLGIIDEEGKPTERARLWRDDGNYPEVCQAIAAEVYPQELRDAVPAPWDNRDAAKRWFANDTGAGDSACDRMSALYSAIMQADPTVQAQQKPKAPKVAASQTASPKRARGAAASVPSPTTAPAPSAKPSRASEPEPPEIRIDLQIHISADASPDQIEQIFAAMAKHIYKRG